MNTFALLAIALVGIAVSLIPKIVEWIILRNTTEASVSNPQFFERGDVIKIYHDEDEAELATVAMSRDGTLHVRKVEEEK